MRNVVERYPVEKLPEELKRNLGDVPFVRITVETYGSDSEALFSRLAERQGREPTKEEIMGAMGIDEDEYRNLFGG